MRYRNMRERVRPRRRDAPAMIRSSNMLPRSGRVSHSAGARREATLAMARSDFTIRVPGNCLPGEPAGGDRAIGGANHKSHPPILAALVLDAQRFSGPHDAEKFRRGYYARPR